MGRDGPWPVLARGTVTVVVGRAPGRAGAVFLLAAPLVVDVDGLVDVVRTTVEVVVATADVVVVASMGGGAPVTARSAGPSVSDRLAATTTPVPVTTATSARTHSRLCAIR